MATVRFDWISRTKFSHEFVGCIHKNKHNIPAQFIGRDIMLGAGVLGIVHEAFARSIWIHRRHYYGIWNYHYRVLTHWGPPNSNACPVSFRINLSRQVGTLDPGGFFFYGSHMNWKQVEIDLLHISCDFFMEIYKKLLEKYRKNEDKFCVMYCFSPELVE